jgi:type VI protein secretion system component VasK
MKVEYLGYAAAAGCAGIVASWLAKQWLQRISEQRFRQIVVWLMLLSGLVIVWQQRMLLRASQPRARARRSQRNMACAVRWRSTGRKVVHRLALQGERRRRDDRPSIGASFGEPA